MKAVYRLLEGCTKLYKAVLKKRLWVKRKKKYKKMKGSGLRLWREA
jgi:hypothetical protein